MLIYSLLPISACEWHTRVQHQSENKKKTKSRDEEEEEDDDDKVCGMR